MRLLLIGVGSDFILGGGEEFGQGLGFTLGVIPGGIDLHETEWLGQPARTIEQPLGPSVHVAFLEVVDELHRLRALGLPHCFENTRLGNPAEIVIDGRPPPVATMSSPTARARTSAWPSRWRTLCAETALAISGSPRRAGEKLSLDLQPVAIIRPSSHSLRRHMAGQRLKQRTGASRGLLVARGAEVDYLRQKAEEEIGGL